MAKEIKVKVDKRIELMGVCLRLSYYKDELPFLVTKLENYPYHEEVEKWFAPFKEHRAIKTLDEITRTLNFGYDAPFVLMTQVDEDLNFYGQNRYPFATRLNKSPSVLKFLDELKDFVKVSKFDEFFNTHKEFYNSEVDSFNKALPLDDVIPFMKKLFHKKFDDKEFIIILALLSTGGGFGLNDFSGKEIYCIESKNRENENAVNWGAYNSAGVRSHYLHEFCHSIINPLTDKYIEQIGKFEIPNADKEKLRKNAYASNRNIINEYIIRAIQLCYIKDADENYSRFLDNNENKIGYNRKILLNLAEKLEEVKNSNSNFEDRFVEIANVIPKTYASLQKEKIN